MIQIREQVNAILASHTIEKSELSPLDFLESFCHLIGNKEAMLREDLMAPVFKTFGENDDTFSNEEAASILIRLTGEDNMHYETLGTKKVMIFKRSYSALVIASLLWRQQQAPFMSRASLQLIKDRLSPSFMTQHTA